MYSVLLDSHVHTLLSGHAYSTVIENAAYCRKYGMQGFVHVDHGPSMPHSVNVWTLNIELTFPDYIEDVRVYRGTEANILNFDGDIDIPESIGKKLEFVIASMHDVIINPGSVLENTEAALSALRKPFVDVIGHPDRLWAPMDTDRIVDETAALGKIIEINNHSFRDAAAAENCRKILERCKKKDVMITLASDAHIACNIGQYPKAFEVLGETGFPEELIADRNIEVFEKYMKSRTYRESN